jgi:hypothetical protein
MFLYARWKDLPHAMEGSIAMVTRRPHGVKR